MSEHIKYNPEEGHPTESRKLFPEFETSLEVTPKEEKRYRENRKFGEAIYKEIIDLVDNESDLTEEYIWGKTEEISKNLSDAQKKVLDKAVEKLIVQVRETKKLDPEERKEFFYESMKKTKGFNTVIDQIPESDVEINNLGAVLVRVKDIGLWYTLSGGDWYLKGNTVNVSEEMDALVGGDMNSEESARIRNLLNKVVFIKDYQESDEDTKISEQVKRHELFHVIYKSLFSDTRTSYGKEEKEVENWFLGIKDELLAYSFEQKWQTDLFAYFKKEIGDNLEKEVEETGKNSTGVLLGYIENFGGNSEMKKSFARECKFFMREVQRLKLLGNEDFEEVIKVVIAAQDLKEIVYNLSKIDEEKILDIDAVLNSGPEDYSLSEENCNKVYDLATALCSWRIPCRGPEKLIEYITKIEERAKRKSNRLSWPGAEERLREILNLKKYIEDNRQKILER